MHSILRMNHSTYDFPWHVSRLKTSSDYSLVKINEGKASFLRNPSLKCDSNSAANLKSENQKDYSELGKFEGKKTFIVFFYRSKRYENTLLILKICHKPCLTGMLTREKGDSYLQETLLMTTCQLDVK